MATTGYVRLHRALILACTAPASLALACSGSSSAPADGGASCGPGTVLVNGTCLVAEASGTSFDATEEIVEDAGADADATVTPDSAKDSAMLDAPPVDVTSPSEADAPLPTTDPCPSGPLPLQLDCSGQCVEPDASNGTALCSVCPSNIYRCGAYDLDAGIVRTPAAATPGCSMCPFDAGAAITSEFLLSSGQYSFPADASAIAATMRVSPPWQLTLVDNADALTYCCPLFADAATGKGCVESTYRQMVFVWTTDPNPVPRNVTVEPGATGCP